MTQKAEALHGLWMRRRVHFKGLFVGRSQPLEASCLGRMDADGHQSFLLRSVIPFGAWGDQPSSNKHRRLPRGGQFLDWPRCPMWKVMAILRRNQNKSHRDTRQWVNAWLKNKLIHGSCFICIIYFFTIAWSYLVHCMCVCVCACVFLCVCFVFMSTLCL